MKILSKDLREMTKDLTQYYNEENKILNYIYASLKDETFDLFSTDMKSVKHSKIKVASEENEEFKILIPNVKIQTKRWSNGRFVNCNITNYPFIEFAKTGVRDFKFYKISVNNNVMRFENFEKILSTKYFSVTNFYCIEAKDFPIDFCKNNS